MISTHEAFNLCTKFKASAASVKIRNVQASKNASHLKMLFPPNLENVTKIRQNPYLFDNLKIRFLGTLGPLLVHF